MGLRGRRPSRRRRLDPKFLGCIRTAATPIYALGRAAGWPDSGHGYLYRLLGHSADIRATALTTSRLAALAALLNYDGPLFTAEDPLGPVLFPPTAAEV